MLYLCIFIIFLDSLDILRPRVKRFCENTRKKTVSKSHRYFNTFRDDSNITGHSISANIERAAASSTSLVLKKTSQREILEKYSVVSYTSLLRANRNPSSELTTRDKPLIKVTVIPKSHQTQTSKHRRRTPTTNKIQNTVSNHEIHTKNLYLVVAGRKKEKVYEIKTTGSAKFSAETIKHRIHYNDKSVKDRSSIKQIIQSLNMDKKKRKGKFRKDNKKFAASLVPDSVDSHHDCRCVRDGRNVDGRKSRVRIFGQVGLTDDERYVLKCDATVDGEPIMTKMISERPGPSQYSVNDVIEPIKYRDCYDTMACFGGYCENDNNYSVENQGTQVNFSLCTTNNTMFTPKRNQTIQCNYASVPNTMNVTGDESERNIVKETQSPLVIISVYPKQELNEAKITKNSVFTNTRPISPRSPTNVNKNIGRNEIYGRGFEKRNDTSPKPSRSPSPKRKNVNSQQKRKDIYQTHAKLPRSRTNSPNRSATCSYKGRMTQNNDRIQTYSSPKTTDESDVFTAKNMQKINNILMSRGNKTNSEIKKALVDDYTRHITETLDKYADKSPRHETSKVKINIDSENEYYDVKFEQGQRTTDLQIRKTLKEAALQNCGLNQRSLSPDNLYLLPEKEHTRKSVSPFKNVRKINDPKGITIRNSKLNVRDSIEICHKRDGGPSKKDAQTHKYTKQSECCRDTDFLAPIKHYKGDSCELPDPIERDKQIRQLLGIVKGKTNNKKQDDMYGGVVGDHGLFDCVYKRDREKTIEKAVSPHDNCGCKSAFSNQIHKLKTNTDQAESAVERTSLYQQLILNRNIQVFLQVEQFTKQKPIILSRKQYDKVKRTIQRTISRKISQEKRKKTCKCSLISVGEVRKRTQHDLPLAPESNKQTQTDEHKFEYRESFDRGDPVGLKISTKKKLRIDDSVTKFPYGPKKPSQVKTIVLFDSKARNGEMDNEYVNAPPRETSSSLEIHYATVGYMKKVTFSSTNVGSLSSSSIIRRNDSLFTIFKGRKRSATPNLGTSELSIPHIEVNSGSAKGFLDPIDSKPKKPFLRRLMSCLVMRSKTSDIKTPVPPHRVLTSVNSSIDSYQFSTSLGAIPMGSSLYDTTASFYTSHSIIPIGNRKMKRGFFSSVREFLTNRRS
ncbi:hypothetical protein O3G_MSEX002680 [Manduca sexta]|uniref:Uncharacterized protein n=2 Tax=Manduca sexta TaxID=7130 RepID=A0A921YPA1_MANSE|nr:hypothetical protein O3G_MSEX002680 [Manduca sexta]